MNISMKSIGWLVAAATLSSVVSDVSAQVEGAYDLRICEEACELGGASLIRGTLVLSSTPLDSAAVARLTHDQVLRNVRRGESANACFALEEPARAVDGGGFLPRLATMSITHWDESAAGVEVLLYLSPDAWYRLRLARGAGGTVTGAGMRRFYTGEIRDPAGFVTATRRGPANWDLCPGLLEG